MLMQLQVFLEILAAMQTQRSLVNCPQVLADLPVRHENISQIMNILWNITKKRNNPALPSYPTQKIMTLFFSIVPILSIACIPLLHIFFHGSVEALVPNQSFMSRHRASVHKHHEPHP